MYSRELFQSLDLSIPVLIASWVLVAATVALLMRRKPVTAAPAEPAAGPHASVPTPEQTSALIRKRRSIFPKDYNGEHLSQQDVQHLLEAANWAPTHGKTEPWRWVVLSSRDAQRRLVDLAVQIAESNTAPGKELDKLKAKMQGMLNQKLPKASHLIMIGCRRAPNTQGKMMPEWEDMGAVAAAVQNLHLMATSLKIAGYWSSWPGMDIASDARFKSALGWAEEDIPMGVFWLGRSDVTDAYRAKRGAVADKTTWQS